MTENFAPSPESLPLSTTTTEKWGYTIAKVEGRENEVKIIEMEVQVFKEMLMFIYTDTVTDLETMAGGLLVAADMYDRDRLKVMCEKALVKSLVVNNAADILILAYLHSADQLKAQAIDYINIRAKDVIETTGYKSITGSYPNLVEETFHAWATIKDRNSDPSMHIMMQHGNFQT